MFGHALSMAKRTVQQTSPQTLSLWFANIVVGIAIVARVAVTTAQHICPIAPLLLLNVQCRFGNIRLCGEYRENIWSTPATCWRTSRFHAPCLDLISSTSRGLLAFSMPGFSCDHWAKEGVTRRIFPNECVTRRIRRFYRFSACRSKVFGLPVFSCYTYLTTCIHMVVSCV